MQKTSEKICREHRCLADRKIHPHSFFEVHFKDKSFRTEHETNWSDMATEKRVKYFGGTKTVMVCNHQVSHIIMRHGELVTTLHVKDGEEVYQAIRSETLFYPDGRKTDRINGRVIGIVKDDEVIEERFLNGVANQILGVKK